MLLNRYLNALVGYVVFGASKATIAFIEDRIAAFEAIRFKNYEEEEEEEERIY